MKSLKYSFLTGSFVLFFLLTACHDDPSLDAATLRSLQHQRELTDKLTSEPVGWKVTYFPRADSLLFSDLNRNIREYDYEPADMGYGGKMFVMHFAPNGTVTMTTDDSVKTYLTPKQSEYIVKQGMMTQLSFTTHTYLHRWVNSDFCGTADFYYKGVDWDGNDQFVSGNYLEPARELIQYERIGQADAAELMAKSYANRIYFEQMTNPQISIRQGDRIYFRSDYPIKTPTRAEGMRERRYAVFLFEKTKNPIPHEFPKEVQALGSGYVGTEEGLKFFPGIRLNDTYIFSDFERVGDSFCCELVRVYSVQYQKYFYGSKHRYPDGEYTGMEAVITNVPL